MVFKRTVVVALLTMGIFASAIGHRAYAGEPAVAGPNGKITAFGGGLSENGREDGLGGIAGSYTFSLAHQFGLQLDGGYARVGDGDFVSTGAHLFWRNPTVGMLGIYGGYARLEGDNGFLVGQDIARAGMEAQKFLGNITLDGAIGHLFKDDGDSVYGRARINFYATENLMFSGGFAYEDQGFASFSTELQIAQNADAGVSLFAEALVSDGDNYSVLGGVRVFLGRNMSLINRHRRQDPESYTSFDLVSTQKAKKGTQGAQQGGTPTTCSVNVTLPNSNTCTCPENSFRGEDEPGSFICAQPT
jgi:hypothetical protein